MRKIKFLILIIGTLFTHGTFSQSDSSATYRNEFGLDVTGTIRFFTKFQNGSDYNYTPTYFLTYRRYFKSGNFRFGIGGGASDQEQPSPYNDSTVYMYNSASLDTRIGWEFTSELAKRWQVYYGLDFRYSIRHINNQAAFFNGGYAVGYETSTNIFGVAPILGFRFRLNNRMSLLTEANFSVNFARYKDRNFYTPVPGSGNPPMPDNVSPNTKSFYTQFAQPIAVFFVFNI